MKAIYYENFKELPQIVELPIPVIRSESVLLEVKAAGLCRSDWHGWQGHDPDITLPHVPGHEFAGLIVEVGNDVRNWKEGDSVTTPFIQACGQCRYCRRGDQQVCESQQQAGFTTWGAFAQYVEVQYADVNLVRIPEKMSFAEAAVLGCRFGTAFRGIVDQGKLKSGDLAVILGAGGVGLSALLIARALGAVVMVIDINAQACELAERLGANYTTTKLTEGKVRMLQQEYGGAAVFVDAVGLPHAVNLSLRLLHRRGKFVQVGLLDPQLKWEFSPAKLIAHEIEIIGSHGIQSHRYEFMLQFLEDGSIDLDQLIRKRCTLQEGITQMVAMGANHHWGVDVITDFI